MEKNKSWVAVISFKWVLSEVVVDDDEIVLENCPVKLSVKLSVKLFLEITQNSQENPCARVSFLLKLQAWGLQLY